MLAPEWVWRKRRRGLSTQVCRSALAGAAAAAGASFAGARLVGRPCPIRAGPVEKPRYKYAVQGVLN